MSAIELQNAPNLPGNWVKPDACGYVQLMKESYPAIKAANSAVTVLTGGLGAQNAVRKGQQGIAGDVFFGQMYDKGAHGYFDALSVHAPWDYLGGLLICTCFRGSPTTPGGHDGPGAEIKLNSTDGQTLTYVVHLARWVWH